MLSEREWDIMQEDFTITKRHNHFHLRLIGQKELSHMTSFIANKSMRHSLVVHSGGKEISFGDQLPRFCLFSSWSHLQQGKGQCAVSAREAVLSHWLPVAETVAGETETGVC